MVKLALVFHLEHYVFQHFLLDFVQVQAGKDIAVALHELACRETNGQPCFLGMVLYQVAHRVQGPVHRAAVVFREAEVLP